MVPAPQSELKLSIVLEATGVRGVGGRRGQVQHQVEHKTIHNNRRRHWQKKGALPRCNTCRMLR